METIKVSARSVPKSVAGAIAAVIRNDGKTEVQAIGAGATNQAVKSIAIAKVYLDEDQIELVCIPSFTNVEIENETRTAMLFRVEKR